VTSWGTVRLVVGREVRQRLRSRPLVVVTLLFAAVLAAASAAPTVLGGDEVAERVDVDVPSATVAVVGELSPAAETALTTVLGDEVAREPAPDETVARQRVAEGDVEVALLDGGRRLLARGASGPFAGAGPPGLADALGVAAGLEEAGATPAAVEDALIAPPVPVEVVAAAGGVDPETGAARFAVAYGGALFLYFVLVFFASLIVNGVVEEKGSRVVELLLPAVPPRQLMGGKVLGLGIVGTLQAVTIVTPALVVLLLTGGEGLPPGIGVAIASVVLAFVLGYALYAGVTAGLASLVSRVEDSQVALFPLYALLIAAFMASFPVLNAPASTLAQVTTFVPFTAPFVVPIRLALVDLPLWQAGVAGVGVAITAVLLTALAARIYEGSILRSGARVRLRAAWRGARE
jgi:ABC-2 type transport system permease protein